jgi:hypothetical protein
MSAREMHTTLPFKTSKAEFGNPLDSLRGLAEKPRKNLDRETVRSCIFEKGGDKLVSTVRLYKGVMRISTIQSLRPGLRLESSPDECDA